LIVVSNPLVECNRCEDQALPTGGRWPNLWIGREWTLLLDEGSTTNLAEESATSLNQTLQAAFDALQAADETVNAFFRISRPIFVKLKFDHLLFEEASPD
jgi:hypothetical protein